MPDRRSERVLEAVIEDYIQTGEPVGSRTVARKYAIGVSSATVRNVMAGLEEMGLLAQPHTSAGRTPTDRALRFYVDRLLEVARLPRVDRDRVRRKCEETRLEATDMVRRVSCVLSLFSHCTGVAIAPRQLQVVFRRIDFVRLRRPEIVVVLVSGTGTVQNRLVTLDEDVTQADLDRASRYLNERLSDLSLLEVKERLANELREEQRLCDRILERVIAVGREAPGEVPEGNVFVEGTSRILDHPGFDDREKVRALLRTLDDKALLVRLLDKTLATGKIQVLIGRENGIPAADDLAIVSAPYGCGDTPLGSIGVIGPRRMCYSKVIPLVDYTAKLLSGFLEAR